MAPKIKIVGVPPYDGEYELPTSGFTGRETHYIKRVSGLRPKEFDEAMEALDTDVMLSFASVALQRAGHKVDMELWDADLEHCFQVVPDEEAEDADRPLASTPTPSGQPNASGDGSSDNENSPSSGKSGNDVGENPEVIPLHIGNLGSVTYADSGHRISGS